VGVQVRRLIGDILKVTGLYGGVIAGRTRYRNRGYRRWMRLHDANTTAAAFSSPEPTGPLFSIVVPTHKYNRRYLTELIDSVVAQDYPHWELVVVNACTAPDDATAVAQATQRDSRIREVRVNDNLHIAGNTNAGIAAAAGSYISLLDHDDTIATQALGAMAQALDADPAIEVLYSDEDKLSDDGRQRSHPLFKPDLNRDLILTCNYVCHFLTVQASLLRKVKGLRSEYDGAQDYDLVLRLISQKAVFRRIPQMSYHWRMAEGSSAAVGSPKNKYAATAGKRALADYVSRSHIAADVVGIHGRATVHRLCYRTDERPKVLAVLASANQQQELPIDYAGEVTFVTMTDYSPAALAGCAVAVFIDAGVTAEHGGWLDELVGRTIQPDTGVVGAAVENRSGNAPLGYVYSDRQLQLIEGEIAAPVFTYIGLSSWPRNYMALPPGCLAVRCELLARHMPAFSPIGTYAVQLSLALFHAGLTNVFWPYAQMKREGPVPSLSPTADAGLAGLPAADPHFNPNLRVHNHRPALRI